jgi:hypothetical protein
VYLLYGSLASAEHSKRSDRRLPMKDATLDDAPSLSLTSAHKDPAAAAAAAAAAKAVDTAAAASH